MTVYYVDDGGSSTAPYDTWAKAAPTFAALVAGAGTALSTGGNVIYVGADSVSSGDGTSAFTGPTTGGPVYIISATVGTTTYAKSSSNQISVSSTSGVWTGNFAFFGIQITGTDHITFTTPATDTGGEGYIYTEDCTFKPGSNRRMTFSSGGNGKQTWQKHIRPTFSAANDSGAQSSVFVYSSYEMLEVHDATFVDSGSHRTGLVIDGSSTARIGPQKWSGADFSTLSGISGIVNMTGCQGQVELNNCKTAASPTWYTGGTYAGGSLLVINSGSADSPALLYYNDFKGTISSDTTNYRNSGATIQSVNVSWKMVSGSHCYPQAPLHTPWIYGVISSTGSKTFTTYITQDGGAGDLNDNDVWLEVEYLGTASGAKTDLGSDRCSISGFYSAAAAQTDDATSTWAGTITET